MSSRNGRNGGRDGLRWRLEASGHRLTGTRMAVWDALQDAGGHITADALFERMQAAGMTIGRMTVYRTLDLLAELGLLRPVYQGSGAAHYILMQDGHHHHLICALCNRMIEFDDCMLEELSRTVAARFGFQIDGHLLEFYGTCAACRTA